MLRLRRGHRIFETVQAVLVMPSLVLAMLEVVRVLRSTVRISARLRVRV